MSVTILATICAACTLLTGTPQVIDGDTVKIDGISVRLKGVDAAELRTERGERARDALVKIIGAQTLTCALTGEKTWRREVGYCVTQSGVDINRQIIVDGFALSCPRYDARYLAFERRTREPRARYCITRNR